MRPRKKIDPAAAGWNRRRAVAICVAGALFGLGGSSLLLWAATGSPIPTNSDRLVYALAVAWVWGAGGGYILNLYVPRKETR